MADYSKIRQLLYRYAYAHNERDPEMLAKCFAKDARFARTQGRDSVVATYKRLWGIQSNYKRRHVITNVFITEETDDAAIVMSYFLIYWIKDNESAQLGGIGRHRDYVILEDGEWKLFDREIAFDMAYEPGDQPSDPAEDLPEPGLTLGDRGRHG